MIGKRRPSHSKASPGSTFLVCAHYMGCGVQFHPSTDYTNARGARAEAKLAGWAVGQSIGNQSRKFDYCPDHA